MSDTSIRFDWPDAKFPDEVLDYEIDWSNRLDDGETISGQATVTVTGGLVVDSHATALGVTTVWLSGGTPGRSAATVDLLVTTTAGRKIGVQGRLTIASR